MTTTSPQDTESSSSLWRRTERTDLSERTGTLARGSDGCERTDLCLVVVHGRVLFAAQIWLLESGDGSISSRCFRCTGDYKDYQLDAGTGKLQFSFHSLATGLKCVLVIFFFLFTSVLRCVVDEVPLTADCLPASVPQILETLEEVPWSRFENLQTEPAFVRTH